MPLLAASRSLTACQEPVVLISGYSIKDFESEANKPDGFLAKPFMMSDIEQLLNSLL